MYSSTLNQMSVLHRTRLALVLLAALAAASDSFFAACEPDADGSVTSVDQAARAAEFANQPKRQYLIAPRIGRSGAVEGLSWTMEAPAQAPMPVQLQHLAAALVVASERSSRAEAALDKPVQRATAFVPRLGKRVYQMAPSHSERRLCALLGVDCSQLHDQANSDGWPTTHSAHQQEMANQNELVYEVGQMLADLRASPTPLEAEFVPALDDDAAHLGKRVVFTPRIGR